MALRDGRPGRELAHLPALTGSVGSRAPLLHSGSVCVAAGLVATFAGRAFCCAALLAAEHDVVLASLVQWVSGARHDRLQFRHADSQSPQLLRLTAQAGQFLVALIGSVDVMAETPAERLDLVAGLPVRRILRQDPVEIYRGRELLHRGPQLVADVARRVPVHKGLQENFALVVRAKKQARQGLHGGQR